MLRWGCKIWKSKRFSGSSQTRITRFTSTRGPRQPTADWVAELINVSAARSIHLTPIRMVAIATTFLTALAAGIAMPASAESSIATPAPQKAPVEYIVGPGDVLNIFVWNHADLSVSVPVRPDGMISTPLAENTIAAGKTSTQLARDLEKALSEYIRSPKVNVIVTQFVGSLSQIRVVGQAANPQSLPYRAGMTIMDVMIAVGGLGEFASPNRAKVIRGTPPNQKEIRVRLGDLMNKGDIRANLELQPGDVIVIPQSRF